MAKYVWSSQPDHLLMEWDLMLELYDRGRLMDIVPVLVGDLTDALKQKAQQRIMQKLGIMTIDESHITHRLRELFQFADKDKSGFIDRDELADCFKKFGIPVTDDELNALLEGADDGDCEIDVYEFEDLIFQLLEDKAGVVLRPEKSKHKNFKLSREDTIRAIKEKGSPHGMRSAGFSPDGSAVRRSPKRSPSKQGSGSVSMASSPGAGQSPRGRKNTINRDTIKEEESDGEEEEEEVDERETDRGFKSCNADTSNFKRATSLEMDEMWKSLEDDGPLEPQESEGDEDPPAFYTNFHESGCEPPMTETIMAQAQRRLQAWLHLELHYGPSPQVLWRATHCRPVPSMDSDSGGRNIKQTVKCLLGFPAVIVQGLASVQVDYILKNVHKRWEAGVKLPEPVFKKGMPRPKVIMCESTGRPAKYCDPLTQMPFRDMHTFHQRRQCFYFDIKKCNQDIIMEDYGTRVTCTQAGGRSVLLTPPIGAIGTSYVEFEIQNEGRTPYFFFGLCEGKHDVQGDWTAHTDKSAALYFSHDGKKQVDGQLEHYTNVALHRMDRVGLLVDNDRGVFEVLVNDESLGVLTTKLPRPMFFVVDMGWPYQRLEILPRTHWQMLAACLLKFFKGMNAQERLKAMAELFNTYDQDGQGSISKDEFRIALESLNVHVSDQELDVLIAKVDQDGSGEIEFEEFRAMIEGMIEEFGPEAIEKKKKSRSPLMSPIHRTALHHH